MTVRRRKTSSAASRKSSSRSTRRIRRTASARRASSRKRFFQLPSQLPVRPSWLLMAVAGFLFLWQFWAPMAGDKLTRWLSPRTAGTCGVLLFATSLVILGLEAAGFRQSADSNRKPQ
ncbi:MAG: hypothetical protein KatS3mg024_0787 [Armatimonadota bacterium]|nr:MAG: hypothetical protein KatS3mg024_0787 [Armatimonadota bacterium]